jgi:PPOX class probable F420-dependent enzyme
MAQKMSDDQWRAFVSAGTRTAKLSSVRADGRPHIAPVWFLLDGDDVVFTTARTTVKGRNLARDPRVSICVDEDRPPYAFVILEGRATLSDDPAELLRWTTRLGGRYMGADRAEEFGRRNAVPGELVVRMRVMKVLAYADIAE